jgi:type IV secretion system protein VirB2
MGVFALTRWLKNKVSKGFWFIGLSLLGLSNAYASTGGGTSLPFDSVMQKLEGAISGDFLTATAIIMIIVTCLMLAFGEWGDGFKKIINIVLWLSVAFAAASFVTGLFGSGAVF